MIAITPVPAFQDNYLWLLDNGTDAVVVDPGDASPVLAHLEAHQLNLCAILVTHHHADHTGGVHQLKSRFQCPVYAPAAETIADTDIALAEPEQVTIAELSLQFDVIEVPGHTRGHIAYYSAGTEHHPGWLFCGDTVFSGGCGRLFEGTAEQMWHSLQKLMKLPDDTLLFPAHEYTLSNLEFALAVEPTNRQLLTYQSLVKQYRISDAPSLPTSLGIEKQVNPFMRVQQDSVKQAAEKRQMGASASESEVFAAIRQWKDSF